jgi:hypothetical protein
MHRTLTRRQETPMAKKKKAKARKKRATPTTRARTRPKAKAGGRSRPGRATVLRAPSPAIARMMRMTEAVRAALDRQRVRFDVETVTRHVLGEDFDLDMVPADPDGLDANVAAWWGTLRSIRRGIEALPAGYVLHDPTEDEARATRVRPLGETLETLTDQVVAETPA